MAGRSAIYLWVALVFAASEVTARVLGIRFASETLGTLYQYLDPEILRNDLGRGLFYLHAQPPLFNLLLGLVLKLFPDSFSVAFDVLFGGFGLALLLGTAWLLRRLEVPDVATGAVVLVFGLTPNFLVYRNWLFYTLVVALLLVAAAVALALYLRDDCRIALTGFAAASTALMLLRSLYHPLWLVFVVLALVPFLTRKQRREVALAALASLLVVNLWFLKNLVLVDSYTASTWVGLSLAKRWPLSQEETRTLKDSGALPPFWHRRPFQEPDELRAFGFFEESSAQHPALDAPYKTNGEPNFNHRDYVAISNALLDGNLHLIRNYPGRYAQRVATALLLYLQPGPNSVHFLVDYDFDRVHIYRDVLTRYLLLGGRIERPIRMLDPSPNLFIGVFLVALFVGVRRLFTAPRELRPLDAFLVASVLWVTAVSNLVEIGENDRMRWEIEPFLAIWLACLLGGLYRKLSSSGGAGTA